MFRVGLFTHERWKKARDAAGGKSGEVSKIDMGKLFDNVHKAKDASALEEALKKCQTDAKTYATKVKPKKAKLADLVQKDVVDRIDKVLKDLTTARNSAKTGLERLTPVGNAWAKVKSDKSPASMTALYQAGEAIRLKTIEIPDGVTYSIPSFEGRNWEEFVSNIVWVCRHAQGANPAEYLKDHRYPKSLDGMDETLKVFAALSK